MTFFVPYDGGELARTALARARSLAGSSEDIVVATVVPRNRQYATEMGWVDPDEGFDPEAVERRLGRQVAEIAPRAEFRCLLVQATSSGAIATRLRNVATEIDASVVFLGSENVGSIAAPVGSIGSNVATRVPYDIYLVQSTE